MNNAVYAAAIAMGGLALLAAPQIEQLKTPAKNPPVTPTSIKPPVDSIAVASPPAVAVQDAAPPSARMPAAADTYTDVNGNTWSTKPPSVVTWYSVNGGEPKRCDSGSCSIPRGDVLYLIEKQKATNEPKRTYRRRGLFRR